MNSQCAACHEIAMELTFYVDLLDSLHCHWYHLTDLGMRIKEEEIESKMRDEGAADNFESLSDRQFTARCKILQARMNKTRNIKELENRIQTSKFHLSCSTVSDSKSDAQGIL